MTPDNPLLKPQLRQFGFVSFMANEPDYRDFIKKVLATQTGQDRISFMLLKGDAPVLKDESFNIGETEKCLHSLVTRLVRKLESRQRRRAREVLKRSLNACAAPVPESATRCS
jgi:hypothetical protein